MMRALRALLLTGTMLPALLLQSLPGRAEPGTPGIVRTAQAGGPPERGGPERGGPAERGEHPAGRPERSPAAERPEPRERPAPPAERGERPAPRPEPRERAPEPRERAPEPRERSPEPRERPDRGERPERGERPAPRPEREPAEPARPRAEPPAARQPERPIPPRPPEAQPPREERPRPPEPPAQRQPEAPRPPGGPERPSQTRPTPPAANEPARAPAAPAEPPAPARRPDQPGAAPARPPGAAPQPGQAAPTPSPAPAAPAPQPGTPAPPPAPGLPQSGQPAPVPPGQGMAPGQGVAPGQAVPPAGGPAAVPPGPGREGREFDRRDGFERRDPDRRGSDRRDRLPGGERPDDPDFVPGGFRRSDVDVRSYDEVRRARREYNEGGRLTIREPGRVIVRDSDRYYIRHDETERFRELDRDARIERRGSEVVTIIDRPGGDQIVTVVDEDGRLLRRTRRARDGREVVLIDNTVAGRPRSIERDVVVLPPPDIRIPRERYVVEADRADEGLIYEALTAPPVAPVERRYTLDEVRDSPTLRARMRSVDIDTITFDSGSWQVAPDQARRLAAIADAINRAVQRNPQEVFLIEGYTDAVGSDVDNLSLSDRRAQEVAAVLTRDFRVPPENLTTQGYGEQYLKVNTQEASRENRRVTVRRITPLIQQQAGRP
ncbi:OmpA family protein [Methylobacterium sp. ID0610]|uniref:OmpA family protein n=1 Tax=Methylobacterium carpenticola TaxID=3344827 RepID=UPI0036A3AAA1